jgi:hypothetical protein
LPHPGAPGPLINSFTQTLFFAPQQTTEEDADQLVPSGPSSTEACNLITNFSEGHFIRLDWYLEFYGGDVASFRRFEVLMDGEVWGEKVDIVPTDANQNIFTGFRFRYLEAGPHTFTMTLFYPGGVTDVTLRRRRLGLNRLG